MEGLNNYRMSNNLVSIYLIHNNEESVPSYYDLYNYCKGLELEPQTIYYEGEVFRILNTNTIPKSIYVGFITPSFLRKAGFIDIEEYINDYKLFFDGFAFYKYMDYENVSLIDQAVIYHGPVFRELWIWWIKELGFTESDASSSKIKLFFSNMWVLKYDYFIEYVEFAKNAINVLENAPKNIKLLLNSKCHHTTTIPIDKIKQRGIDYFTYHPFLVERLICFFVYIKRLNIKL